jgi:hypothetical protein
MNTKFAFSPLLVVLFLSLTASSIAQETASVSDSPAKQLLAGESWEEFCERLKQLGKVVLSDGVPKTEIERTEGYRYLLSALAESIDVSLHRSDVTEPQLRFNITKYRQPAMPSADARYLSAEITGDGLYRLSGTLGNAPHITVQAYGGVSALESFDIRKRADAAGNFSFLIGDPEKTPGAAPISSAASMLFLREYYSDWETERPSKFFLERLDRPDRGTPITSSAMADILEATASKLESQVPYWKGRMDQIRASHDNSLAPAGLMGDVGLGDILYGTGWFELEPDEAMLIELSAPDAVHWSFQLGNYWGEAIDFANYTSSTNGDQATASSDGRYRIVIAHNDPGVPNWLDTAGHREGMIFYRYHLAKSKPMPTARVVKRSDLPALLPKDTVKITPVERRAEIDSRRAAITRRRTP